jgi:Coenzyme PQQ synthesis protein D (PqqD)
MLRLHCAVLASKDQVSCTLGDETAILHLGSGVYYSLNPVGTRVWALLQEPVVVQQLRDRLLAEFDVPQDRLEGDLSQLLDGLAAAGLIEIRDEPTP